MIEFTPEQTRKIRLIAIIKESIAFKERILEMQHVNNPYTTEFMDEAQIAERRTTIELTLKNIAELKLHLQMVEKL